ncbi:Oidioi.mRNA.OKI2018_I69.PAR.g12663.t1.cds [Oikopleura dioica]|uniref:Oidioi.mRNA.OKI2018_I69.PAR.g12663.t1.cds n=1 Tax=Oikopleura dioica TaxID=34765 RepID=A0ABN7S117_OIKDI|nr:Oidioi.mRNA.OKI2018_I69.PAR.g12663.t1.cds [Oikopleura dioica]
MVEVQPWRLTDSPRKLIEEARDLQLSIKEAKIDNDLPYCEIVGSRTRLRDIYRSLLVADLELALDQKIEQDLWNNCFKNPINELLEAQRSSASKAEFKQESAFNYTELLESAYAFYLQLLDDICEAYSLQLPNRATDRQLKLMPCVQETAPAGDQPPPRATSSLYIAQHCLIHLGDIARYRHKQKIADSFYRKASQLVPSSGHPYNQLAILAATSPDNLQTVYYYFRAMYVKCPFPVSKDNLSRQLEKVLKSAKSKVSKKPSQISILELMRLFLKFQALCFLKRKENFSETKTRLVQALEFHRSLGSSLSKRQLLQMSFITIANYHRAVTTNFELHEEMLDFLLEYLDILIQLPVDPQRHLPSVLAILQFLQQNLQFLENNKSRTWINLASRLNNTLPPKWGPSWEPKISLLPEDLDFKGWTLWNMPPKESIVGQVSSESDQADARAERILYISWQIAHTKDQQVLKLENCIFVSPIKPLSPGIQEHGPIPIQPPPPVAVYPTVPPPPTLQTVPNPPPIAPSMPPPPPQHFMQGQPPAPVRPKDLSIDTRPPPPFYPPGPPPNLVQEYKTPLLQATGPEMAPHLRSYKGPPPSIPPPRMSMPPPHLPPQRLPMQSNMSPSGDMNIPANIMDFLRHIPPPSFPPTPPGSTPASSAPPAHEPPLAGPFGQTPKAPMAPPPSHNFHTGNIPHTSSSQYSKISPSFNSSSDPFNPSFSSTIFQPASSSSSSQPLRPAFHTTSSSTSDITPPEMSKPRQREPWQTHRRGPSSPGGTDFFPPGESPFSFPEQPVSTTQPIGSNRPVNLKAPTPSGASSNLYFPTTSGYSTSKPVLDPDSYDRKLSPFWDPALGTGYGSRDIWAPPSTTSSSTSLDLNKLIDSLPNDD